MTSYCSLKMRIDTKDNPKALSEGIIIISLSVSLHVSGQRGKSRDCLNLGGMH